jgi:hypothetical protein
MPFKSRAQARAAFGGYLGKKMQGKADQWAHETPGNSLPQHAGKPSRSGKSKKSWKWKKKSS